MKTAESIERQELQKQGERQTNSFVYHLRTALLSAQGTVQVVMATLGSFSQALAVTGRADRGNLIHLVRLRWFAIRG
jgi:hypothetical protein